MFFKGTPNRGSKNTCRGRNEAERFLSLSFFSVWFVIGFLRWRRPSQAWCPNPLPLATRETGAFKQRAACALGLADLWGGWISTVLLVPRQVGRCSGLIFGGSIGSNELGWSAMDGVGRFFFRFGEPGGLLWGALNG